MMKKNYLLPVLFLLFISCESRLKTNKETAAMNYPAEITVKTRADWGWKPGEKKLPEQVIKHITIHHSGEYFAKDKDVAGYLRNLQSWSRSQKNWMDIPYHYIIDLRGVVYEARPLEYPGDTNTNYDPRGHALICVLGNYEVQVINKTQLNTLIKLSAYLARRFKVPVTEIKGHKDYAETLCPGKDLYRYLQDGTIQREVAKILAQSQK